VSASALALPRRNTPARRRAQRRRRLLILGLMSPWLIGFCIFFGYPLVYSVYLSFTHYDLLSSPRSSTSRSSSTNPRSWTAPAGSSACAG